MKLYPTIFSRRNSHENRSCHKRTKGLTPSTGDFFSHVNRCCKRFAFGGTRSETWGQKNVGQLRPAVSENSNSHATPSLLYYTNTYQRKDTLLPMEIPHLSTVQRLSTFSMHARAGSRGNSSFITHPASDLACWALDMIGRDIQKFHHPRRVAWKPQIFSHGAWAFNSPRRMHGLNH